MSEYSRGFYSLVNASKYAGKNKPYYRSSWERRLFYLCDNSPNIIEWSSENFPIPYLNPILGKDGKQKFTMYYPDVYVKILKTDGSIAKLVIEVKPYEQTIRPELPKVNNRKAMKNYHAKLALYMKNLAKWEACKRFCEKNGFKFEIFTEKDLF